MIRTIAVQGYRSVRDLRLELDGFDVVTGANGAGKSNLYRALRLLAGCADGSVVGAIARDGGLASLLWAGMERPTADVLAGHSQAQGTVRKEPVGLRLGYATDDLGYLVDLGIPPPGHSPFVNDPEIKREQIFHGELARPASLLVDRRGASIRVRDDAWRALDWQVLPHRSVLAEAAGVEDAPEIVSVRAASGPGGSMTTSGPTRRRQHASRASARSHRCWTQTEPIWPRPWPPSSFRVTATGWPARCRTPSPGPP